MDAVGRVEDAQARRLLNDLASFTAHYDLGREDAYLLRATTALSSWAGAAPRVARTILVGADGGSPTERPTSRCAIASSATALVISIVVTDGKTPRRRTNQRT